MEGGDDGVDRVVDSKDMQQQSKALDKLTDRVEDRQLDSTRVQEVSWFDFTTIFAFMELNWKDLFRFQAMASISASKEADIQAARLRYFLASVSVIFFLWRLRFYVVGIWWIYKNHNGLFLDDFVSVSF